MAGERRKRWKRGRPGGRRCAKVRSFGVAVLAPTTEMVRFMDEPEIVACVDGPLLIRGDVELVSSTGEPIPRRRSTIALCRCGASTIKPFCDGSHKVVGFRTEPSGGAAGNGATSESASSDGTVSEGGRKRSHSAKNGTERRGAKRHAS